MAAASLHLTNWDKALVQRYLGFYTALRTGERKPQTDAQRHFILVCRGRTKPRTQHEIAYTRYLALGTEPHRSNASATAVDKAPTNLVEAVDQLDIAQLRTNANSAASRAFDQIKVAYQRSSRRLGTVSSEAALWSSTILADFDLVRPIERWSGATFNTLSTSYTKAMDGAHALGLKAGEDYISPFFHRLFHGHTPWEAWIACRDALTHDTFVEEAAGMFKALSSDLSSVIGLPILTLTKDSYGHLEAAFTSFGIPKSWLLDAMHYNAVELAAASLPVLAGILNWSRPQAEEFARMVGSLGVSAVAAGNPIMAVVFIVMLARSLMHAGRKDGRLEWASALASGGVLSAIVLTSSAVISGPTWVGIVSGIVIVLAIKRLGSRVSNLEIASVVRAAISSRLKFRSELSPA